MVERKLKGKYNDVRKRRMKEEKTTYIAKQFKVVCVGF